MSTYWNGVAQTLCFALIALSGLCITILFVGAPEFWGRRWYLPLLGSCVLVIVFALPGLDALSVQR